MHLKNDLEKIYKSIVQEALGLSSFKYDIPKDPEQRLYDFYFLTLLGDTSKLPDLVQARQFGDPEQEVMGQRFGAGFMKPEQVEELAFVIKETQDKLLDYMRTDLLDAVEFSIAAEMRHLGMKEHSIDKIFDDSLFYIYKEEAFHYIFGSLNSNRRNYVNKLIQSDIDHNGANSIFNVNDLTTDFFNEQQINTIMNWDEPKDMGMTLFDNRHDSIKAARKYFDDMDNFIDWAESCFKLNIWATQYGGPAWVEIAKGYKYLSNSNPGFDSIPWIDHIFDLEHNTGNVLNKVDRYDKNGYGWIKKALDFKRDSITPMLDFLDKISPSMNALSRRIRYAMTGIADDNIEELRALENMLKKVKVENDIKTQDETIIDVYNKYNSTKIAHTGPAGKKDFKTLVIQSISEKSRHNYSGYLKISNKGTTYLRSLNDEEKNLTKFDKKVSILIPNADYVIKKVKPKPPKAVVDRLNFRWNEYYLPEFSSGVIYGAYITRCTIGKYKLFANESKNVVLLNCYIENCKLYYNVKIQNCFFKNSKFVNSKFDSKISLENQFVASYEGVDFNGKPFKLTK